MDRHGTRKGTIGKIRGRGFFVSRLAKLFHAPETSRAEACAYRVLEQNPKGLLDTKHGTGN